MPRKKSSKSVEIEQVAEISAQETTENETPWNKAKVNIAERMLQEGFSVQQIGRELRLTQQQKDELSELPMLSEAKPQIESFDEWKKRMSEEVEKTAVTLSHNHMKAVAKRTHQDGYIDPETMGTVKDASAVSYLWLKKGTEGQTKSGMTIDFRVLANAQRPTLGAGTGSVVDLPPSE